MATIKSFTSLEQSRKLAEILPLESADMQWIIDDLGEPFPFPVNDKVNENEEPCWSLAALLSILHNKTKDIPSLSGGGYKDGKYTSDWYLDYEFENGNYQKTFADNPVDACYEMILKLHEKKIL